MIFYTEEEDLGRQDGWYFVFLLAALFSIFKAYAVAVGRGKEEETSSPPYCALFITGREQKDNLWLFSPKVKPIEWENPFEYEMVCHES